MTEIITYLTDHQNIKKVHFMSAYFLKNWAPLGPNQNIVQGHQRTYLSSPPPFSQLKNLSRQIVNHFQLKPKHILLIKL